MGIPAYLSYIIRNYPGIVRAFSGGDGAPKFNHMYFDSNSIVYDAYRQLQEEPNAVINDNTIIDKVILKIEHLIESICAAQQNCPLNTIFIALDGVSPFAKITQQRQRRFRSSAATTTDNTTSFSTIKITPGTEFMKLLTLRLTRHFSKFCGGAAQRREVKYSRSEVIISGSDIPGEGEHKIFQHIRENACGDADATYVIYGLDADLIMLSINHLYISQNIYIFRETPEFRDIASMKDVPYTLLNISKLAKNIELHTGADAQSYIFLCFLLGNDFLPHFPALNLRTNGMDILLESYKKIIGNSKLIKNGRIQWRVLFRLLKYIASIEHELFIEKTRDRDRQEKKYMHQPIREGDDPDLHIPIIRRELEKYICPEEEGWETRYYRVLFDFTTFSGSSAAAAQICAAQNDISNICLNLLHGLEWTFKYYCGNCVDWRWKYNYHYAPLITDFIKYIPQFETDFFCAAAPRAALHPDIQLACVLPLKYLHLLPNYIREHIEKKYMSLYPQCEDIRYIWAYCRYNWESHLILPELTNEILDDFEILQRQNAVK